jgi:hypothetical protein
LPRSSPSLSAALRTGPRLACAQTAPFLIGAACSALSLISYRKAFRGFIADLLPHQKISSYDFLNYFFLNSKKTEKCLEKRQFSLKPRNYKLCGHCAYKKSGHRFCKFSEFKVMAHRCENFLRKVSQMS